MKRLSYDKLIKFILLFFAILIMSRASLFRSINPFGISFVFVLIASNIYRFITIPFYFISNILLNFCINNIIIVASECAVLILITLLEKMLKKKIPVYLYGILLILSQSAYIYFNSSYLEVLVKSIASVFISFISFYIFDVSLKSFLKRGKILKFTIDEKVCHAILIIAFFSGLSGIYLQNIIVTNIVCLAILFCISRVATQGFTICFSSLAGLGVSLYNVSIVPLALFSVWSTVMITFNSNKKIVASIMVLASDVIMGVFLNTYANYDLWIMLSTFMGLAIICFISDKKLLTLSSMFGKHIDIAKDFACLRHEKMLNNKLKSLSSVFFEMENLYKTLLIGDIDKKSAIEFISRQATITCCRGCENYKKCFMGQVDIKSAINALSDIALEKNKITMIDVPSLLVSECYRVNSIISNINSSLLNLKIMNEQNKSVDKSNIQVANQLYSTGLLIKNISSQFDYNLNIDYLKSSDLYEELVYNDIPVNDVVCIVGKQGIEYVVLSVANSNALNPLILKSVNKIFKLNFKISERMFSNIAGFTILLLLPSNNYSTACGVATLSKIDGDNCGDSYSILKLDNSKYFYAICDGMGSGESAHSISSATISLIENYYKAGFDSDSIISSVNNILLPLKSENFSTLDGVIVDINSGRVDFIKIGASISIIKSAYESKIVESESLPLGVTENLKPSIKSFYLDGGDIIILASDGVVDSFSSLENFLHFINNERLQNVQLLAENILEEAKSRSIKHKDDMTVLAIKLSKSF